MKFSNNINNKRSKGTRNIVGSFLAAGLFMFGAASCTQDSNVVDNGVVNEDYTTEEVANTDVNAFTAWDYNSDDRWDSKEFASGMTDAGALNDWDTDNDDMYSENEFNEGFFSIWDRDNDGYVNEEEYGVANAGWEDNFGENFDDWDVNGDNILDNNEFSAGIGEAGVYDRWDMDFDGTMTDDEFYTGAFESWDNDNDGYLGFNEYNEIGFDNWGL